MAKTGDLSFTTTVATVTADGAPRRLVAEDGKKKLGMACMDWRKTWNDKKKEKTISIAQYCTT